MTNENYTIYVHKNKCNNKIYIGQTKTSCEQRWQNGNGYKPCIYFWRAIQKYGWENFEHIILFDGLSKEVADIIEKELIEKYQCQNPQYGYNIRNGGSHGGLSEESKVKISNANKGRLSGEKNPMYGKPRTEETKNKIRQSLTGKQGTMLGKHLSEEAKEKLRQYNLGKVLTQEHKDKISASLKGRQFSDETKNKISVALLGRTFSEEHKSKLSDGRHGANNPYAKSVNQIDAKTYEIINSFGSIADASKQTGVRADTISATCRGKQRTAGGYIWEYVETH